jgi:Ca2+/Na+ antiporter
MATEESERDLGFFNDMRAELLPLVAGLVSFTILGEKAVNNIGAYFSVNPQTSIFLFSILYFLFPIAIILLWMFLINHRDGLKEHLLKDKGSSYSWIVLAITALILLMMFSFFDLNVKIYLAVAVFTLIIIGCYGCVLVLNRPDNVRKYRREYRQAKYQYVVVSCFFIILWFVYFWQHVNSNDSKFKDHQWTTTEINEGCSFRCWVLEADIARSESELAAEKLGEFRAHALSPIEIRRKTNKWSQDYAKAIYDSIGEKKEVPRSIARNASWKRPITIADKKKAEQDQKKGEQEEFYILAFHEYKLSQAQQKADDQSRLAWAKWMEIVQFKGLLLFLTTTFFLLTIWYHSYLLRLKSSNETHVSEVQVSRVAIYIIFLLIIPFFKPIDENSVNFDKPYLSLSNQFSFADNRDITNNPAVTGTGDDLLDEKLRKIIKEPVDNTVILGDIQQTLAKQQTLLDSIIKSLPKPTGSKKGQNQ